MRKKTWGIIQKEFLVTGVFILFNWKVQLICSWILNSPYIPIFQIPNVKFYILNYLFIIYDLTDLEFLFISLTRPRTFIRLWKFNTQKCIGTFHWFQWSWNMLSRSTFCTTFFLHMLPLLGLSFRVKLLYNLPYDCTSFWNSQANF